MSAFEILTQYGESVLGVSYPVLDDTHTDTGNMDYVSPNRLTDEQRTFFKETAQQTLKRPIASVRAIIDIAAGAPRPSLEETARDLELQQVRFDELEQETDKELLLRRRAWRHDLKRLRGIRQALQQGETR